LSGGDVGEELVRWVLSQENWIRYQIKKVASWLPSLEIDEIVGRIFLEAWKNSTTQKEITERKAWLRIIARNQTLKRIDYLKAARRIPQPSSLEEEYLDSSMLVNPEQDLIDSRMREQVRCLLEEMPKRDANIYALVAFDQERMSDVAKKMGCDVEQIRHTVKSVGARIKLGLAEAKLAGVVVTAERRGVPDVEVTLKGRTVRQAVLTDEHGAFVMFAPPDKYTLSVKAKKSLLETEVSLRSGLNSVRLELPSTSGAKSGIE
jgi:RNA polymerase sigma factor (sigma-70 family)